MTPYLSQSVPMTKIFESGEIIPSEYVFIRWSYGLGSAAVRGDTWGQEELWFDSVDHSDKHCISKKKRKNQVKTK